jgi:hypothetical protein
VKGGHCLVNWSTCLRPKKWEGRGGVLGIKDLDKFSRALRLRWLWQHCDIHDRQWKNLVSMQDQADMALFFSSTYIHIGNGRSTTLWEAKWLHGAAPKEIAPNLYASARCKRRPVFTELHYLNWIRNIKGINTTTMLDEYILLYMSLSLAALNDQPDEIIWKWTANGKYSTASAYACQFRSSMVYFPAANVWKASTEPKFKFFAWLVRHNKTLTADNMLKKNWECNPTCPLCYCLPETADHLLSKCNFAEALWQNFAPVFHLPLYQVMMQQGGLIDWVLHLSSPWDANTKRNNLGLLFFFWWSLWKERN